MPISRQVIFDQEQEKVAKFFGHNNFIPKNLPGWITDELIEYWEQNIFHLHFLPAISINQDHNPPNWRERPYKIFYQKIKQGHLPKQAQSLPGKWILIDARNKPAKGAAWVTINDVWLLTKIGLKTKNYFKKWSKQLHQQEYLAEILQHNGFGSRFCLSIDDINNLKPFIIKFLKLPTNCSVRLPYFLEYNYLVNFSYSQWSTTETWEWFEDKFDNKYYLAGGSKSVSRFGWEPSSFWSTILTFRPVIEIE